MEKRSAAPLLSTSEHGGLLGGRKRNNEKKILIISNLKYLVPQLVDDMSSPQWKKVESEILICRDYRKINCFH